MHIEIQVALNFIISYLFNKLPRRRVNLFGEELDKAIRHKFAGHWYPEYPSKGSAYRCIRVAGPPDPVLSAAARESGLELQDVLELLPAELNVWVDPGEVSYRIGEKTMVKILYSAAEENKEDKMSPPISNSDREVARTFNPEAQCFKPVEPLAQAMHGLTLASPESPTNNGFATNSSSTNSSELGSPSSPVQFKSPSPQPFVPKSSIPLTFTTASFAQTKFGSTKLKSSGRRPNRLSPTELSHYIKQRSMLQTHQHPIMFNGPPPQGGRSRSISPNPPNMGGSTNGTSGLDPFLFMQAAAAAAAQQQQHNSAAAFGGRGLFDNGNTNMYKNNDLKGSTGLFDLGAMGNNNNNASDNKLFVDNLDINLNALPYLSQFQHLLVAN